MCLAALIYVCYLKRGVFRDPTPFFDKENRLVLGPYRAGAELCADVACESVSSCRLAEAFSAACAAHLFACIAFSVALVVTFTAYVWHAPAPHSPRPDLPH